MATSGNILGVDVVLTRSNFKLDINFSLTNHLTGLFGPSGSGKTTILNLIAGLARPDEGRVAIADDLVTDIGNGVFARPHLRGLGYVFQESRIFPHLNVRKNLLYGEVKSGLVKLDDVVDILGLQSRLQSNPRQLSGGELRRVAIGRALLGSPRFLLLDEAFSSIDAALRARITNYLRTIRIPALLVSHYLPDLLKATPELILIDGGQLVFQGRYEDMIRTHECTTYMRNLEIDNIISIESMQTTGGSNLVHAEVGDNRLSLPDEVRRSDTPVMVRIDPRDIAIALDKVSNTSIQNQLKGKIVSIREFPDSVMVEVDVGCTLMAEISNRACQMLRLGVGTSVYCLVKSRAIQSVV